MCTFFERTVDHIAGTTAYSSNDCLCTHYIQQQAAATLLFVVAVVSYVEYEGASLAAY